MTVVYGESNCGKTFFMLDLGLHIAAGVPWRGLEVSKRGVLYLALEGRYGITNRVAAFKLDRANVADLAFAFVPVTLDLLDPAGDTLRVIEAAKAAAARLNVPVGLVVVDTLSRAMAGGNENSSEDMTAFIRQIDLIRQALPAHVVVIHHSGKDTARGARGHSSLRAATDTEIEVSREYGSKQSVARVNKQRDLDGGTEFPFQLVPVELGRNQRGKPVTSCVVRHLDAEGQPTKEFRATQRDQQKERLKKEFERKQKENDEGEVLRIIRAEAAKGLPGASRTLIQREATYSDARAERAVQRLLEAGTLVETGPFERPSGHGAASKVKIGYGIAKNADQTPE
jgi:RecA-family ATPase